MEQGPHAGEPVIGAAPEFDVRHERHRGKHFLGQFDQVGRHQQGVARRQGEREEYQEGGQDSPDSPFVEMDNVDPARVGFATDDSGDEETRNDEEDIDPDIAAADPAHPGMKQHDRRHRDRAQPVNVAPILLDCH